MEIRPTQPNLAELIDRITEVARELNNITIELANLSGTIQQQLGPLFTEAVLTDTVRKSLAEGMEKFNEQS